MNGEQPAAAPPAGPSFVPLRAQAGWLVPLFLLCFVIFAYQFFAARNSDGSVARLAGEVFVYALFISMGLTMVVGIFLRPFSARRGGYELGSPKTIAFVALFSSFLGGTVLGATYGRRQDVVAVTSVVDTLTQFRREAEDGEGKPMQTSVFAAKRPRATGAYGELERLILGVGARLEAERNEYFAEMEAIGWNSVLDPARLKRDTSLADSRAIVRQAKAIIDKEQVRLAAAIREARQGIERLSFDEVYKQQMLAGFDSSMARSKLPEIQRLDRESIDHVGRLVEILAASQYGVGWTVQDGTILFHNDDAMNKYNSEVEALQQTAARQDQLFSEHAEGLTKRLAEQKRRVENGR